MKLQKYLDDNGIKKKFFAEKIGLSPSGLTQLLRGKARVTVELVNKIYEETNGQVAFEDWQEDQN